jgi:hypothetical protein
MSALGQKHLMPETFDVRFYLDSVAKSKVAPAQIFGENLKRKEVDDSRNLSRATEVAHEFGARR